MSSDDLNACVEIVYKGDPARFRAAMAAPLALREKLLPLYAFNVEVARAPWVTNEAMIAEMRLQWWHDALEEIGSGAEVRRHEVVTPLAEVLSPAMAQSLQRVVAARRWDIYDEPFADEAALWAHLENSTGALMEAALGLAGHAPCDALKSGLSAMGLAGWLTAVPILIAAGRSPLPDPSEGAISDLAKSGLSKLKAARGETLSREARKALLAGWQTKPLLRLAKDHPERVLAGTLELSPFRAQMGLIGKALVGRW